MEEAKKMMAEMSERRIRNWVHAEFREPARQHFRSLPFSVRCKLRAKGYVPA